MNRPHPNPARSVGPRGTSAALALVATALAAAVALSGCQVMSPIQTDVAYQPADGVAVDLGEVQIRDLVVVASAKGEDGVLSGMVLNKSSRPVTITFAAGADGASAMAQVLPGAQARLSGVEGSPPISLPALAAAPGDVVRLTVSTPASGASEVSVPVLLPAGYYATITPAPSGTATS